MTDSKRPLRVFLCHASVDKPAVRDLYKRLKDDGVDAWLDAESLIPGQNWQVEIPNAIRTSDVVLVCLSGNSVNKEGYVQKEIKFALDIADEKPEGTIFIIPARLENCETPSRLSMYHWVDLYEPDGYERLMRALRMRATDIGATLQIKKSWLPSITTQRSKRTKTDLPKKARESEKEISLDDATPTSDEYFPPGWEETWQPSFSETETPSKKQEEKQKITKPKSKIDEPKPEKSSKQRKVIIIPLVLIGLILAAVFGLPPLFSQPGNTPEPTLTLIAGVTIQPSPTEITIVTEPSSTPTKTITPTVTPLDLLHKYAIIGA